jgi:2-iminobutanoate/2-iminopropanoate deaminase
MLLPPLPDNILDETIMMNRLLLLILPLLFLVTGCGPNEKELRRIVREELSQGAERAIYKPGNVIGPYSPAVRAGRFLFVSGQIALDPETGILQGGDIERETRQVLDNLRRVLAAAGYDSSHVVSTTVYLKNMGDYQKMNAVYGGFFQEGAFPARVAVQVAELPRQANVEIAAVAYKP